MQIKEVSNRTGLTIKTIRFYEERGLITPKIEWRNGKNYRDYQERDIEQLNMVAVLRKCLFSIDQIKTMLDHPELTQDVFMEYRDAIVSQRDLLALLADKAESVEVATLKDPETLARKLTFTASPLPLPSQDVSPHFGQFDPETPEERQAAYIKWQKRYRYRNLRWQIPLGLTVLMLLVATVFQVGRIMNSNEKVFFEIMESIDFHSIGAKINCLEVSPEACKNVVRHLAYGVYDAEGNLLPEPTDTVSDSFRIPAEDRQPDSPMFETYVGIAVRQLFTASFSPWGIKQSPALCRRLVDYVGRYGMEGKVVNSTPFWQTFTSASEITVYDQSFKVVLYFQGSPILMGMRKMLMAYLTVALVWGLTFAFRSTQGYGFKVRFLRSYVLSGPRSAWNDAMISVDEKNGNATVLTQQFSGMSNLVNMDYKKDE